MSQPGVPVCPGPPAEGDCGNDTPSWHCRPCLESRRPSTLGLRASSSISAVLVCSDRRLGVRVRRPQRNAKMDRFRRRISRKKVTRPLGAAHISRCCHGISFYIFLRYSRHYYHLPSEPPRPHSSLEFDHRTLHRNPQTHQECLALVRLSVSVFAPGGQTKVAHITSSRAGALAVASLDSEFETRWPAPQN